MNLELLDPFRRQIPDRVDSTLHLPTEFQVRRGSTIAEAAGKGGGGGTNNKAEMTADIVASDGSPKNESQAVKAANHIVFNRRGSYVAVGYGSGALAVYDVVSRTLSGLYRPGERPVRPSEKEDHGLTSISWSRRSRTMLAGALKSKEVWLVDTTHPFGPEDCCSDMPSTSDPKDKDADDEHPRSSSPTPSETQKIKANNPAMSQAASFAPRGRKDYAKRPRQLQVQMLSSTTTASAIPSSSPKRERQTLLPATKSTVNRYPWVQFDLPLTVGSSLQIHPRDACAGHATLSDGSLVAFWVPVEAFDVPSNENGEGYDAPSTTDAATPMVRCATIFRSDQYFVTCSAWDPHDHQDRLYAATRDGKLLGFEVARVFDILAQGQSLAGPPTPPILQPNFVVSIPGGATTWQIAVSRNGSQVVVNSSDAALRLYSTKECWMTPEEVEKPKFVFQDVVSKVKFASCDLSGDGEYIVGGANGLDDKYELHIWNTSTGGLMDKLTGANVELYSVAWHPTRSFIAVATSDGLVDVWGPKISWTQFAPDFQSLPANVEYVECEDEFDVTDDNMGGGAPRAKGKIDDDEEEDEEKASVDILTIVPVPVFQSDSEEEEDVFHFETKIVRPTGAGTGGS